MYVMTDESGRVTAATDLEQFAEGMTEVEEPEVFDRSRIGDWVLTDGSLVHDGAQTAAEEAARQEAEAAAARRATIDAGAAEYFADGGREQMQAEIDAAYGGSDPQLQAIARMQVMTMDLEAQPSSAVAEFRDYWPEWQPDTAYGFQQPLQYDGSYFRTSQALTSSSTYPPGSSESLYYEVEIAPDGVIVYRTCHGSYDAVQKGETRHYPDADGPIYRSKVDNNAYSPDVVPANWEPVSDAGTK